MPEKRKSPKAGGTNHGPRPRTGAGRQAPRRPLAKQPRLNAPPARRSIAQPRKEVTSMALDDVYENEQ